MDRQQIQEIILRVLSECQEPAGGPELPLDVPVEVSAKHVHLTAEAVEKLFGAGAKLTPKRPLSQPGQFLSEERVAIVTPRGRIENVAVLGPERPAVQTELSATDCRTLGIQAPLRMSGDLRGAADVYLVGPKGMVEAKGSAIVAQAHIHITPSEAAGIGITDGQQVSVTIPGQRPLTLEHVICRVSSQAALAMHIDYDEANACMLPGNTAVRMRILPGAAKTAGASGAGEATGADCLATRGSQAGSEIQTGWGVQAGSEIQTGLGCQAGSGVQTGLECQTSSRAAGGISLFEGKLITEAVARQLASAGSSSLHLPSGAIITPSAIDVLRHAGIEVLRQTGR